MKRISRFLAASAAIVALAASCTKAEMEDASARNEENGYDGPVKTLTFNAVIGEPSVKTALGDVREDGTVPVIWENGDKVKVIWGAAETDNAAGTIAIDADGVATLSVVVPSELAESDFYAVYPASVEATADTEAGTVQVTIPTETGSFKTANIMVAKASAAEPTFSFKHAVGIVRFQMGDNSFKANGIISRLSLYSGVRAYVAGDVLCSFDDEGAFTATSVDNDNHTRYVTASALSPEEVAYVAVWPDYTFEEGFIAYYFNEQRSAYYEKDLTIARGEILNLGNIQDKMRTDFFIKPGAKGDGSSWENAAGEDFIRAFFAPKTDEGRAYAHCQKCENTNFWFAAGEYVLGTEDAPKLDLYWGLAPKAGSVPVNFFGGCAAVSGKDKTRNPETYETIFTGKGTYGILAVRNKADLTLDGITLRDAVVNEGLFAIDGFYGAALYVAMNTAVTNKTEEFFPRVRINNCKFVNNVEDVTSSLSNDFGGGVALNLNSGKLYVNNCEFTGNVSHNRGPVRVGNSAADGSCMFLNSCTFTGNYARSGYGRLVWAAAKTCDFGMNNCMVYSNDSASDPSTSTGVFALNSPYVLVNNTFVETTKYASSDHGIIRTYVANYPEYSGTIGVLGNNIIVETSSTSNGKRRSVYTNVSTGYSLTTISYGNNVNTKTTYSSYSTHTASDKDKTGVLLSDLSKNGNYYYWTAGEDETYAYAVPSNMVAATKANTLIGDSFHDWLVEIGAIVDGKFTDCRGWLRAADKMCPGAYDPWATKRTE